MNRIQMLRKKNNMNQTALAKKIGVSQSTLSYWERGDFEPDHDSLIKIADFFEVSIDYLLGRTSEISSRDKGVKIPVLGRIAAGVPLEAIEDILDYEEIPESWTTGGREYFALKIRGDSMAPKYLNDDIVIFLKSADCASGTDCAVIVNGDDAVFKRVIKQEAGMLLQPLNTTNYESRFYGADEIERLPLRVIGVAREIRRQA